MESTHPFPFHFQITIIRFAAAIFVTLTSLAQRSRGLLQEQTTDASWVNDPGGMLSRSCVYGFGIVSLRSIHDAATNDRSWYVQCGQVGDSSGQHHCRWTCKLGTSLDSIIVVGHVNYQFKPPCAKLPVVF